MEEANKDNNKKVLLELLHRLTAEERDAVLSGFEACREKRVKPHPKA